MQKLWLKNFELHINPSTWNLAQDLIQAGAVRNLREVEKHFWVALVQEGEDFFETEAIITPHKIKAFTCECWSEGRRLMCAHVAAALFKVRQFLEQKAEARQQKESTEKTEEPGRLTVQTALGNATPEQLAEFVRAYARKDRDFALALKTWFAGHITSAENPFTLLLESALPRHAGVRPLREPEMRRLRKMLDELETQLESAAGQANVRVVFQIGTAILQKVVPLLPKTPEPRQEQLVEYCLLALRQLSQLPPEHASPELREAQRLFLFELAARNTLPAAMERDMVLYLSQAALEDDMFERIRLWFDQTPAPAPRLVLHSFLAALARRNRPEAVVRVLEDYDRFPGLVKDAIVALYYLQCWPAVLVAGDHFLQKKWFNAGQVREVEDLLLLAAEKAGDKARHLLYLRNRYAQTGNQDLFRRLQGLAGEGWPAERLLLFEQLRAAGQTAFLAPLLAAEGDLDGLAEMIRQQEDLRLLQQYEDLYLPLQTDFVREQYVTQLSGYLHEHFGRQASGYVREQLAGLLSKKQMELAQEIIQTLTRTFVDRHTLPEELAELFPKSRRRPVLPT
ncbi:MAG: hypothetical protein IT260_07200 [Saprospiraceae bacterium]|nr:hypothetical protein [Saprospiraceae bacterium]